MSVVNTTLNKLVWEIIELYRGVYKDSDPLEFRLVVDWVQSQRARFLKQKFSKTMYVIDESFVQDLGEVEMETSSSIVTNTDLGLGLHMLRTSIDIPRTIEGREGIGTFTRIGPADRLSERFNIVTYDRALVSGYGKFNRDTIYAFTIGDRIYITSKSGAHLKLRYIDIRGVFQNPILAARIKNPAWSYDDDYPISMSLVDDLKLAILKEKFPLVLQQLNDTTDDLEDNYKENNNAKVPTGQTEGQG